MFKKVCLFCLLLTQIVGIACTSGKRAFENGNYERAIYLAVERLRRNPDHTKSRQTLDKAYQLFIKRNQADIQGWQASVEPFKWDNVVSIYENTHSAFDQIKACPGAMEVIKNPLRFDTELQNARRNASEGHYEAGLSELQGDTREKAKIAYTHFEKAQDYFPNLKSDYKARLNEAKQKATLHVAVWIAPLTSNFNLQKYQITEGTWRNNLNQYIQELDKKFFLDAELIFDQNKQEDFDDILKMAFTQFNPEPIQYTETHELPTDSIRVETQLNGQTFVRYDKVQADINIRQKIAKTTGTVEILITDTETGQILFNQSAQGEYIWQQKWALLSSGDIRAANATQKELLNKREESPPSYQIIFDELQAILMRDIRKKLNEYYQQY